MPRNTAVSSENDGKIGYTVFKDLKAKRARGATNCLRQLKTVITSTYGTTKADLPLLSICKFGDNRTAKGSLRHDANVTSIHGVVGDYDGGIVSANSAAKRLKSKNIEALIYTSPSNTLERPRWRVLCPASRELPPTEYKKLVARVNGVLGGILAPESFMLSQSYYFGQVEDGDLFETHFTPGRCIDHATELDSIAIYPAKHDPDRTPSDGAPKEPMGLTLDQTREMLAGVQDWANARDTWRDVGFAVVAEHGHGAEAFDVFDEWSQRGEGYDARENRHQWHTFKSDRPNAYTMRSINRELGLRNHPAYVRDDAELIRLFQIMDDADDLIGGDEPRKSEANTLEWFGDFKPVLDQNYLVKDVLNNGCFSVVWGNPKAGKTFAVIDLCFHLAAGIEWNGHKVKKTGVLYLSLEGGDQIKNRMVALQQESGARDIPFALKRAGFNLLGKDAKKRDDDVKRIVDLHASMKDRADGLPTIIVIDTLNRALQGGDESSSVDMGTFTRNCDRIRESTGAHVLVVHHSGKDVARGMRGHSSLLASIDHEIFAEHDEDTGSRTIRLGAQRDTDSTGNWYSFRLKTVELGKDVEGDAVRSAVVEYVGKGKGEEGERREDVKSKAGQRVWAAYDEVRDVMGSASEVAVRVVHRAACRNEGKSDGAERQSWHQGVRELIDKNWIQRSGDRFISTRFTPDSLFDDDEDEII